MSSNGTQQLQMLIFLLAVFHMVSSLLTLGFGEIKMKKWRTWEQKAGTLEYQLSNDPRRFKLTKQTSFGKRHLKFWSNHWPLLWIVCFLRQFSYSVSRADYFALRNGYIDTHLSPNSAYNFHKFLRRSLDKDFKELVTISPAIWMIVILFILFNAHVFYSHYWLPFIPLVVLLAIGTKLEVIITKMCLKSSKHKVIVSGEVYVNPNDDLFWFGRPRWLLHAIHFILIQNSFQLAFVTWSLYKYGFHSCFHRKTEDFVLSLAGAILVQFLCAYVTLPLYSLVNQMGSTMKETIFTDRVVAGIKNWHGTAKRSLFSKETGDGSNSPSTSSASPSPLMASPRAGSSWWTHRDPPPINFIPIPATPSSSSPSPAPLNIPSRGGSFLSTASRRREASRSAPGSRPRNAAAMFEFPTRRQELEEIQNWHDTAKRSLFSKEIGDGSNSQAARGFPHLPPVFHTQFPPPTPASGCSRAPGHPTLTLSLPSLLTLGLASALSPPARALPSLPLFHSRSSLPRCASLLRSFRSSLSSSYRFRTILDLSAKELYFLKSEEQGELKFNEVVRRVLFSQYLFKLKVKEEIFSYEQRVKSTAIKAERVNPSSESKFLLGMIERLS